MILEVIWVYGPIRPKDHPTNSPNVSAFYSKKKTVA